MVCISWAHGSKLLSAVAHHRGEWNAFKSHSDYINPVFLQETLLLLFPGGSPPTPSTFPTQIFNNKNILGLEMLLQDRFLVSSAWPWSQTLRLTLSMGGQVMVSASPALCDSQYQSSANPIVRQFSWCKGDRNLPHKEWIFFFSFKNKYSDLDHFVKQGDPHHLLLLTVLGKPVCLLFKSHYICKTLFSSLFLFLFFFFLNRWDQVGGIIPALFSQSFPT